MDFKYVKLNEVKVGSIIEIEGFPCKIQSIEKSKPGKHGSAKARIVGVDVFTDRKYTLLSPMDEEVRSPIINRSNAQVIADLGNNLQLMDTQSFEMFEVLKPTEKEILAKIENGVEVEYIRNEVSARIIRVR